MAYLTDQIDNSRMHYSFLFFFFAGSSSQHAALRGSAQASLVAACGLLLFWTVASLLPCGMCDLTSLTRNQTCVPCIASIFTGPPEKS